MCYAYACVGAQFCAVRSRRAIRPIISPSQGYMRHPDDTFGSRLRASTSSNTTNGAVSFPIQLSVFVICLWPTCLSYSGNKLESQQTQAAVLTTSTPFSPRLNNVCFPCLSRCKGCACFWLAELRLLFTCHVWPHLALLLKEVEKIMFNINQRMQ